MIAFGPLSGLVLALEASVNVLLTNWSMSNCPIHWQPKGAVCLSSKNFTVKPAFLVHTMGKSTA